MKPSFKISLSSSPSWPDPGDLQKIALWDKEHFPKPWTEAQWQELAREKDYLLLSSNSGFALFKLSFLEELAHLLKIVVLPSERGQGKGKELLYASMEECRRLGLQRFYLEVEEDNTQAQALYRSLGFKTLNKISHFYGQDRHAWTMGSGD